MGISLRSGAGTSMRLGSSLDARDSLMCCTVPEAEWRHCYSEAPDRYCRAPAHHSPSGSGHRATACQATRSSPSCAELIGKNLGHDYELSTRVQQGKYLMRGRA